MKALQIIFYIVVGFLAISLAFKLIAGVVGILAFVLKAAIPIAIIGGVGYLIYKVSTSNKSLPDSQKRLP